MSNVQTGFVNNRILKIQVGFLLSEGVGQSRDFEFDVTQPLRVADDLTLDYLSSTLHLSRTSRGILVQGALETQFAGACTRCLENTLVSLEVPIEELYVYPPEPSAEFTVSDDGFLDIAPLLREEIVTNTPIGILCKADCAGLCPTCGQNLNDGTCECEQDNIDPRLAALKTLKDSLKD